MLGQSDYDKAVATIYSESNGHFHTPVELFQPYYSQAICRWLLRRHRPRAHPLTIVELGPGLGTNAQCILDHLKLQQPTVYQSTTYHLVEISPALAQAQESLLSRSHPGRFVVHNQDILTWNRPFAEPVVVLALEVLDNLAHDKLLLPKDESAWQQVTIAASAETASPLTDELARAAKDLFFPPSPAPPMPLSLWPSELIRRAAVGHLLAERARFERDPVRQAVFVPSDCVALLRVLRDCFPGCSLLAADFDMLPLGKPDRATPPNTPGALRGCFNSPLVSSRHAQTQRDFDTLLVDEPVDIFFQTDFEALRRAAETVIGAHNARVVKSREFFTNFAKLPETETRNGYNPLIEDFANTSMLIVDEN